MFEIRIQTSTLEWRTVNKTKDTVNDTNYSSTVSINDYAVEVQDLNTIFHTYSWTLLETYVPSHGFASTYRITSAAIRDDSRVTSDLQVDIVESSSIKTDREDRNVFFRYIDSIPILVSEQLTGW